MSNHNTITSNVSDVMPQKQSKLRYLQNLQDSVMDSIPAHVSSSMAPYPADNASIDTYNQQQRHIFQSNGITNAQVLENLIQHQRKAVSMTSTAMSLNRKSSLHAQRANQQNLYSPIVTIMPINANPTEVLAQRFAAWRSVIRSILIYLTETISIQDEIVRQQLRLANAVNFPFFATDTQQQLSPEDNSIQKFFLPSGNGSIQDLPLMLAQYHNQMASLSSKASKELSNEIIPRLEDMRRDLLIKIKEIRSLQSDFKNSCAKELQETKALMKQFQEAIEQSKFGNTKQDPYLIKIQLDKQIKRQLTEENFLHEAFNNLQNSGRQLEKVVMTEVQNTFSVYARLLGQESQLVFDTLIARLDSGFFGKDPVFEWDNFILKDPNFIEPNLPMRHMKDIVYKNQFDTSTYELKSGFLERRSKFLKSYSKGFYVLTPNFLHEFKTGDRRKDLIPVMSLSLNDCTVAEHSKKGSSDFKFILHAKQNGIIHRGHNWVFRVESYESMMDWFVNIKKLTTTSNPSDKAKLVMEELDLDITGKPKKSIESDSIRTTSETRIKSGPSQQFTDKRLQPNIDQRQFTPNLDDNTNTNTSVSIPDTSDYAQHMVSMSHDHNMNTNGYTGSVYFDSGGKVILPIQNKKHIKDSDRQMPHVFRQYSLEETDSNIV